MIAQSFQRTSSRRIGDVESWVTGEQDINILLCCFVDIRLAEGVKCVWNKLVYLPETEAVLSAIEKLTIILPVPMPYQPEAQGPV